MRSACLAVAALWLAACVPQATLADRVTTARARADQTLGVTEAIELAQLIHAAHENGEYAGNTAMHQGDVLSGLYALERVALDGRPRHAEALAWRGILFFDVGRMAEARDELVKSYALQPTWFAAQYLIPLHGTLRSDTDTTGALETITGMCKTTLKVTTNVDDMLRLIDLCKKQLGYLVPVGQEMAWLDPKTREWHVREVERRDKRALAEQEARRIQKERAEKVARYVQRCSATCHDTGTACLDRCESGDASCDTKCRTSYDACVDRCEATAIKSLPARPAGAT